MRKVARKNCYRVSNKVTKKVFAKCTKKVNAKKQLRLLRAISANETFRPRRSQTKTRKNR